MIGTRKSDSMYLIKDLPLMRVFAGGACLVSGLFLLIWRVLETIYHDDSFDLKYLWSGVALVLLGYIVLRLSPTTVFIINRELGIITISKGNPFTSSYFQFSSDEIQGEFLIHTEFLFGKHFPTYRIELPLRSAGHLEISRNTRFFREVYDEAVAEANTFAKFSNASSDTLPEPSAK
jgi:hypothetical protein